MATFFNQAVLSYNGNTTTSNITTGELLEVLSATKTAVDSSYRVGDSVTYVVNILNSGTAPFNGLTLTDNLGAYTVGGSSVTPLTYIADSVQYYVNGVLSATPTVSSEDPLTVTGISVPAGGNAAIIYQARVNSFAPLATGTNIINSAQISGAGLTSPISADATVDSASEARLTISKAVSPSVVSENGQLTYTFVIQNSGNTAAETTENAIVTDTFDPRLSNLTVTYNGTTWTDPANYTYDESTGLFTTGTGQISVPAATYTQDPTTGVWTTNPGVSVLTVTGTV